MDTGYNGWKNWETWNVALWLLNDEGLYQYARQARDYDSLASMLKEILPDGTPDGAAWDAPELDYDELDDMLEEL